MSGKAKAGGCFRIKELPWARETAQASSDLKAEPEVPAEPGGGGTSHRRDVVSVTRPCSSSFLSCADGA